MERTKMNGKRCRRSLLMAMLSLMIVLVSVSFFGTEAEAFSVCIIAVVSSCDVGLASVFGEGTDVCVDTSCVLSSFSVVFTSFDAVVSVSVYDVSVSFAAAYSSSESFLASVISFAIMFRVIIPSVSSPISPSLIAC